MIKKEIQCILISFLGILLAYLIWDYIKIPYKDQSIYGLYSINKHHALNDILRVLIFIFLPFIFYFISKIFFYKKNYLNFFFENVKELNIINYHKNNFFFNLLFFVSIFFLLLEFFSLNFQIYKMDVYHEGQRLSSAYRHYLDGSLWSKSYVTVGIFYETLLANFAWKFFNNVSIGSFRFFDTVLILIFKITLTYLSFIISKLSNFKIELKYLNFILLFIVTVNLADYQLASADLLNLRDLAVLFTSIIILKIILNKNVPYFLITLLGLISILSFFWAIDRGLVCNLLIIFSLLFFLLKNQYSKFFFLIISIFFFWFISYIFLNDEFIYFVKNSLTIISEMSYIHGIIFPKPFGLESDSSRAAKNLIVLSYSFILLINLYIHPSKGFSNNTKFALLLLSIISLFSLLYVFGRSDGPHIKNIFGYSIVFFTIFILNIIFSYINTRYEKFIINIKSYFVIFVFFIIGITNFNFNFSSIINFNDRLNKYVLLEDEMFLNKEYKNLVIQSKNLVSNYNCIQLYTNDAALLYLLRKKNCTKYYFLWSVGSKNNQKNMIAEMKDTKLIISNGKTDNWDLPLKKKLYLVNDYIETNFSEVPIKRKNFIILKRN